ncbi:MAG TPA: CPBP family intramembrane glutamic endopeptidase [Lachnospiraceae bacterium]|nr:CPBP family intramembrane glutamic endopeptidase [Lachnospiraceae bacterium]
MNKEKKERVHLIIFVFVSLVIGWIGVLVNKLLKQEQGVESLGSLLFLVTPLILSIVFRTMEKDWKHGGLKPNFKGNGKWYAVSIILYPAITAITVAIALLTGQIEVNSFSWQDFFPLMLACVGANFIRNIAEEFSWRGYLTQKLVSFHFKDWQIYLVTGLTWNLWHGAYYMVFLPDDYVTMSQRITLLVWGCVILVIWSFLFGELYRLTHSVWPCVLMHAVEDGVPTMLFVTSAFMKLNQESSFILDPTQGLISLLIMFVVGVYLRRRRQSLQVDCRSGNSCLLRK